MKKYNADIQHAKLKEKKTHEKNKTKKQNKKRDKTKPTNKPNQQTKLEDEKEEKEENQFFKYVRQYTHCKTPNLFLFLLRLSACCFSVTAESTIVC